MSSSSNCATCKPRNRSLGRSKDVKGGGMHSVEAALKRAVAGEDCLHLIST